MKEFQKTVFDKDFKIENQDLSFNYQNNLTNKLDNVDHDFDIKTLYEIVLWKVNRYVEFDEEILNLVNSLDPKKEIIDNSTTKLILKTLISKKGIQLPMASTILRFRNPNAYQIIDQRVFRIIYPDKKLKISTYFSDVNIEKQIELYLTYLKDLRIVCDKLNIPFEKSDRILYMADKRINKNIKLDNYSISK